MRPPSISINAPRAGCNVSARYHDRWLEVISINAPHAGCNSRFCPPLKVSSYFNLMHPVRGATLHPSARGRDACYFNLMHPMRGATPFSSTRFRNLSAFLSINAPHAGCNSKTIQFKRILVARRIYSFANYVLHILKHLPTYCIGTTF